ncbi:MAG: DNA primase large subunit PriL [Thermoplasmata archaeon]|nr:DNA primase large subunit PriL [Thermoplasmata archaeon]
MDLRLAAKYPFLKESGTFLKAQGVTLDRLIAGRAYERARFAGKERVMESINEPMIQDHPMASSADATNELLSYPVARMIVSAVGDPMLINRYAIAEAKRADRYLNAEGMPFVMQVAADLGLDVAERNGEITVDFADFLRFSAALRSKEWKLINQRVKGGRVVVPNQKKLVRLVQQLITERISSELPLPVNDDIMSAFAPDIEEIRGIYEKKRAEQRSKDVGKLSITRFPPCMRKLLGMIQAGQNVPHSGRFALVAFLHTLGMNSDEVLETFSAAPDFDEGKSRYQIQHITGEISGTEYTPPECSTMKSYGICYDPDSLCEKEWMNHPLKYYRQKGRPRGPRPERKTEYKIRSGK